MADLSKFLQAAKQNWGEAVQKASQSDFENPPDGVYIMQLASAELQQSKNSGRPMVRFGHVILEGDLQGKNYYDYIVLDGKLELQPLIWRLKSLGVNLEDLDISTEKSFDAGLQALVAQKLVLKVSLVTKDEYQNMKVNAILPGYEAPSSSQRNGAAPPQSEKVELVVGMKVSYNAPDGAPAVGVVKSIDETAGTAKVRTGLSDVTIQLSSITDIIDEGVDS